MVTSLAAFSTVYFLPLGEWLAANPLPGQGWMRDHLMLGAGLAILAGVLGYVYFQADSPPAVRHRRDARVWLNTEPSLRDLRAQMRKEWIDRVLARSLERIVPVELSFADRADAITNTFAEVSDEGGTPISDGTSIEQLFDSPETVRRLVILGQPGAGKTTQLLHLAEALLGRADTYPDHPVPVILPLSAGDWSHDPGDVGQAAALRGRDKDLAEQKVSRAILPALDWMATEISARYLVPKRQAHAWLVAANSPVVVLLDGLDEIRGWAARINCVKTLAHLRVRFSFAMAVSCRSDEFKALGRRLNFGRAVEVQPIAPDRVDAYLAAAGPELEPLRHVCRGDKELMALFSNPLALAIAVLTYRGRVPEKDLLLGSVEQRLDYLWDQYLDQMLHRRRHPTAAGIGDPRFPPRETRHWLVGLARSMQKAGRTEFRLELIDVEWLPTRSRRFLQWTLAGLWLVATALALRQLTAIVAERHDGGLAAFAVALTIIALVVSMIARFKHGQLSIAWEFEPGYILIGLGLGVLGGFGLGLTTAMFSGPVGLLAGLIPGTLIGLVGGLAASAAPTRIYRETREKRSAATQTARVQLAVTAAMTAVPVLAYLLTVNFISSSEFAQRVVTLVVAPVIGVVWGSATSNLYPWASHRVAGLWSIAFGLLPRRLAAFLEHVDERIIMRRMSGGYQFLHLTLQEHLATGDAGRPAAHPRDARNTSPARQRPSEA